MADEISSSADGGGANAVSRASDGRWEYRGELKVTSTLRKRGTRIIYIVYAWSELD